MATWTWFHKLGSPPYVYRIAGRCAPWFGAGALLCIAYGLFGGLVLAPPDYQQKDAFRIVYVHAPAAWLSLSCYTTMAVAAFVGLVWRMKVAHAVASALAPVGASFAFVCLVTGSLWGRPMWGTWWVWDARLTSELILFFLYMGYIALTSAIDDPRRADRAGGLLALVGAVNVPIIYFSVKWWNTLHQGASISVTKGSSMAQTMLWAMLLMALAFWAYSIAMALYRVRGIILQRERHARWVQEVVA